MSLALLYGMWQNLPTKNVMLVISAAKAIESNSIGESLYRLSEKAFGKKVWNTLNPSPFWRKHLSAKVKNETTK